MTQLSWFSLGEWIMYLQCKFSNTSLQWVVDDFFKVQHEIFFVFMQPWIPILRLRGLQILQSQKIYNLETALVFVEYHVLSSNNLFGGRHGMNRKELLEDRHLIYRLSEDILVVTSNVTLARSVMAACIFKNQHNMSVFLLLFF